MAKGNSTWTRKTKGGAATAAAYEDPAAGAFRVDSRLSSVDARFSPAGVVVYARKKLAAGERRSERIREIRTTK